MSAKKCIERRLDIDSIDDPTTAVIGIYHLAPPVLSCLEFSPTEEYPDGFDVLLTADECLRLAGLLTQTAADLVALTADARYHAYWRTTLMNIPGQPRYYVIAWIVVFLLYAMASTQDYHDALLINPPGPDAFHQLTVRALPARAAHSTLEVRP